METKKRIVTELPLTVLWRDEEELNVIRGEYLTKALLHKILKKQRVEFALADIGQKLKWVSVDKCFEFWKSEVLKHLIDNSEKIFLDNFTDSYCYIASEWTGEIQTPIVLLEKIH